MKNPMDSHDCGRITRRAMLGGMAAVAAGAMLPRLSLGAESATRPASKPAGRTWGPYRGANMPGDASAEDVAAFAALGGNLLRLSFNGRDLMRRTAPYDFQEDKFEALDRTINACEAHGIHVVIDPHTPPGTRLDYSTSADDEFWKDFALHEHWIRLWERLASTYKDRGEVIAGYDLLNEPTLPPDAQEGSPADWNLLVRKLARAIRAHDTVHALVIEENLAKPDALRTPGPEYLDPPFDDNAVYSLHMYNPFPFTHQGLYNNPAGAKWPGEYWGQQWDRERIAAYFAPWKAFQEKYDVPIFVGEFGALRWIGPEADQWIEDVASVCEANGWSWAYWAWREWHGWNAEMSNSDEDDTAIYETTPRLELLKRLYAKNNEQQA